MSSFHLFQVLLTLLELELILLWPEVDPRHLFPYCEATVFALVADITAGPDAGSCLRAAQRRRVTTRVWKNHRQLNEASSNMRYKTVRTTGWVVCLGRMTQSLCVINQSFLFSTIKSIMSISLTTMTKSWRLIWDDVMPRPEDLVPWPLLLINDSWIKCPSPDSLTIPLQGEKRHAELVTPVVSHLVFRFLDQFWSACVQYAFKECGEVSTAASSDSPVCTWVNSITF